jgi:hypothetical protein
MTRERIVEPRSAAVTVQVELAGASMRAQLSPLASQRRQRYSKLIGAVPVQLPSVVVKISPTCVNPETRGRSTLVGGTGVTTSVDAEPRYMEPAEFVAITRERIVEPTSAEVSV